MKYFVNVDVALRDSEGRWALIVRGAGETHAAGKLSVAGGTVEEAGVGSDVLERTAQRELLEELDVRIELDALAYVESSVFTTDNGERVINVVFAAELPVGAEPRAAASDEVAEVVLRTLDEVLADDACPPWTSQSLTRAARVLDAVTATR